MTTKRRNPRFGRFLVTGGLLGLLAAAILVVLRGGAVDRPELMFWYLGIVLAGLGTLLGGAVAVVLDRPRGRR